MFNGFAFNKLLFQYIFFLSTNQSTANADTYYEKYSKQYYVYCAGTAFKRTVYFFIII